VGWHLIDLIFFCMHVIKCRVAKQRAIKESLGHAQEMVRV